MKHVFAILSFLDLVNMIDSSLRLNILLFKRQTQLNKRLLFFVVNNAEWQSAMQYAVLHQHESFLRFVLQRKV